MGGGVMRTAGKVAALAGYRSAVARRASLGPSAASASSFHVATEGAPVTLVSASSDRPGDVAAVQPPGWAAAIEDWEFDGGSEGSADLVVDPPPRLVFGSAPTFEEAREATSDLKAAMEQVYFSSPATEEYAKMSDHEGSGAILPAPNHVVQAFSLLQRSSEAQDIVASLACDHKIWEAVMNNNKVKDFCSKNQSMHYPPEMNFDKESVGENDIPFPDTESFKGSASSKIIDFVKNFKTKVSVKYFKTKASDMASSISDTVTSISDFVKDFMWSPSSDTDESYSKDQAAKQDAVGKTLMALAVAVILLLVFKRV